MLSEQTKVIKKYEPFILGQCQCGCGTDLPNLISKKKSRDKYGFLRKYLNSAHSLKGKNQWGENNVNWKGGEPKQDKDGYWLIYSPHHPHKNAENRVFAHRLIYENYLSILFDEQVYLPEGSEIHHIDKNPENNALINLKYMNNHKEHAQEHLVDMKDRKCSVCGIDNSPVRSDSNGRQKWFGNEKEGWRCVSCEKKAYYIKNREQIRRRKNERYKLTGKR